jgi:hypothetical protein
MPLAGRSHYLVDGIGRGSGVTGSRCSQWRFFHDVSAAAAAECRAMAAKRYLRGAVAASSVGDVGSWRRLVDWGEGLGAKRMVSQFLMLT